MRCYVRRSSSTKFYERKSEGPRNRDSSLKSLREGRSRSSKMIENLLRFGKDKTAIADLSSSIVRCVSCATPPRFSEAFKGSAKWPFSASARTKSDAEIQTGPGILPAGWWSSIGWSLPVAAMGSWVQQEGAGRRRALDSTSGSFQQHANETIHGDPRASTFAISSPGSSIL